MGKRTLSRRALLKGALAAAGGLLVSERVWSSSQRPSAKRVVVVGAGLAGLTAAHELRSAGYDVQILEARARVGGRVWTIDRFRGTAIHVDAGGEFIGANHLTWVALAKKFDIELSVLEDEDDVFVMDGEPLDEPMRQSLLQEREEVRRMLELDASKLELPFEPWNEAAAQVLDSSSLEGRLQRIEDLTFGKWEVATRFVADNGVPSSRQSYLGVLSQIKGGGLERFWEETEVFRCAKGSQALAAALQSAVGTERVRFSKAVRRIDTTDASVRIQLADGEWVEGDDVILAAPPSVWRHITFHPSLPAGLRPQLATHVKAMLIVDRDFWGESFPALLSDGTVQMAWEGTPRTSDVKVLSAFSGGNAARISRGWSTAARDDQYVAQLKHNLPDLRHHLKRNVWFHDWTADGWSAGSYSFPAPGEITRSGALLNAGIGRLHFAGEHTCYPFAGYMEGALRSGLRVAEQLCVRDGIVRSASASASLPART